MFYKTIENARNKWIDSPNCPIKNMIDEMVKKNIMRDAQIEAIKTYLYLKIECDNQPLAKLFYDGKFNNYSDTELEEKIKNLNDEERRNFFNRVFNNVNYTDYLFSLPMGAGKTFLMAAFIYIDLYFAMNDKNNPAFAHNFIILIPSGLKSSVVPSLKTIKNFNPSWIFDERTAAKLKRELKFEILDQNKTGSKSNKVRNPNVQKISKLQPFDNLFGLVAVTNAEKVILDRITEDKEGNIDLWDKSNDEKDKNANELRNLIGKIPQLSIFVDEVHHVVKTENRLRTVINKWAENNSINSVIGFSGTPYYEKPKSIEVAEKLSISSIEISNTVCYFPLTAGIGNFLKHPVITKINTDERAYIVETGVSEFLKMYKDKVYEGGLTAKLGIYCGTIKQLEEEVYPLVVNVAAKYGISADSILKYHRGNETYKANDNAEMQFNMLDTPMSKIRIVLLVQIGKEGWDCRSLTGIILSQKNDCPQNMVLQTSCRCLRQVVKNSYEKALIYLNEFNYKKLESQLQKQQHISIQDLTGTDNSKFVLPRYDRTEHLKLPKLEFYQLKFRIDETIIKSANPSENIEKVTDNASLNDHLIYESEDFSTQWNNIHFDVKDYGNEPANFYVWLYEILKNSSNTLTPNELKEFESNLRRIFEKIIYPKDGIIYFSSKYNQNVVSKNIRKAFCDIRNFKTKEELIPQNASLLNIKNFNNEILTDDAEKYYPDEKMVKNIIADDKGELKIDDKTLQTIQNLIDIGQQEMANSLRHKYLSHPQKDKSFHYLPYQLDSGFEKTFIKNILPLINDLNLEVYYNGDGNLTEFRIQCSKIENGSRKNVGIYTPDFLIIQRHEGKIYKVVIVETKGSLYSHDPNFIDRRHFMENDFLRLNNEKFGYKKFDYLYLEDSMSEDSLIALVNRKLNQFFN